MEQKKEPIIYTHKNSSFGEGPYKRLEIDVTDDRYLWHVSQFDELIEKHFPGITRENIFFGLHWRGFGYPGRDRLHYVLQAFGQFD